MYLLLRAADLFSEHSFPVKIQYLCPITVFTCTWCTNCILFLLILCFYLLLEEYVIRLIEDPGWLVSVVVQRTESVFFSCLWNSVLKLRHLSTVVEKLLL